MSISSELYKVNVVGDGSTPSIAFNRKVFNSTDIVGFKYDTTTNVETALVNGTDFTVTGAGNTSSGVTITPAAAIPTGTNWVIYSDAGNAQTTTLTTAGEFPAKSLEYAFDRLAIGTQEADGKADRALKLPISDTASGDVPNKTDRASKALGFDSNGDVSMITLTGGSTDNAAGVAYDPSGSGAVATTVQDKLRESVSVKDFGAVGDGVADDTAAIQAAVDSLEANGGGVLSFPRGTYLISSTITVNASNIMLLGEGGDQSHDVGTQGATAASKITWGGGASPVVQFVSPSGASNQKQNGGGMEGFFIQCYAVATFALQIVSWNRGIFRDLCIINPATSGIDIGVQSTLGEARDSQNNHFSQISIRCVEGSSSTASFIQIDGDSTANTSLNVFEQINGTHDDGDAYVLNDSDNNVFIRCRSNRTAGGTGDSIDFRGSDTSAAMVSRNNVFWHFSGVGAIQARGTTSYTHASYENHVLLIDKDNSTPDPTIETGSSCFFSTTSGYSGPESGLMGGAFGEVAFSVSQAMSRRATTTSCHIYNGSEDHAVLDDGTNKWSLALKSGNLTATRLAGTGYIKLPVNNGVDNYANDSAAASGGVPVGGMYRNGSVLQIRVT